MPDESDTIFAAASGSARAAITVVRLSGLRAGEILDRLCRPRPRARIAALRSLRSADGDVLDRAVVLWFPGPGSYTGEDAAELHLHGGSAVLEGVTSALLQAGGRPAEPGEFTRRAFLNGRMDLLEAEAVADLVEAETQAQRRQALRQLDGALGILYRRWTETLTGLLARQEALIDFPEETLPDSIEIGVKADVIAIHNEIVAHLDDGRRGERLREGLVIAVSGAPNVGKSTLVNALAGRDVAIVSPQAGTTRDVLEARAIIEGVPVTLLDTAGLRETDDAVEAEGIRRARARASAADLLIVVHDVSHHDDAIAAPVANQLVVFNKADLATAVRPADVVVSALTGLGMEELRTRLGQEVARLTSISGSPTLTRARHRTGLEDAAGALDMAMSADMPELRGEALRQALRGLGRVTGHVGTETVLDAIFRQFCIGK